MRIPPGVVKVCLVIGGAIDAFVGLLALFAQALLGPLLDVPVKDPALTTIAGGEFVIVAALYFVILRDLDRFRPLLWLVALDQFFAAVLVLYEIHNGHVAGTWKTIGPVPFNIALAALFAYETRSAPAAARN